jgi:hypothetical protein
MSARRTAAHSSLHPPGPLSFSRDRRLKAACASASSAPARSASSSGWPCSCAVSGEDRRDVAGEPVRLLDGPGDAPPVAVLGERRSRLVPPERFEPLRGHLRVPHGMLDVPVPEVVLEGARVLAVVGQLEAAGVPEHVRIHREADLRPDASAGDQLADGGRRQWPLALGGEAYMGNSRNATTHPGTHLALFSDPVPATIIGKVAPPPRRPNAERRTREHLKT